MQISKYTTIVARIRLEFHEGFIAFATLSLALSMVLGIRAAYAIGPTLPLRFIDSDSRDRWTVGLAADPKLVRVVRVERQLYADGARLRAQAIDVKFDGVRGKEGRESRAPLSLRFEGMEGLKQRAFAQKIVVEAQWIDQPGAKVLHIERWFYFAVKEGKVERIDAQAYSDIVDRAERALDSRGKPNMVTRGGDLRGEVPLPRTKGSPAVPVRERNGAIEENVPRRTEKLAPLSERSEVNEK